MKTYDVNYSGQVFTVEANDESEAIAKVRATQTVDFRTSPVVTESVVAAVDPAPVPEPESDPKPEDAPEAPSV